jgi:hypothetical protein
MSAFAAMLRFASFSIHLSSQQDSPSLRRAVGRTERDLLLTADDSSILDSILILDSDSRRELISVTEYGILMEQTGTEGTVPTSLVTNQSCIRLEVSKK